MSNELIPASMRPDNEVANFDDVAASGVFLPRLQLMTSSSGPCKSGEFPVNHFSLIVDGTNKDLGSTVDVLVCAWRAKALDCSGEKVIESLDPDSEIYADIVKRSKGKDSSCMHGPEYLAYIPEEDKFATCFFGSATARREARSVHALLYKGATLSAKKCENSDYTWFTTTADECSTVTAPEDAEVLQKEINDFVNPPVQEEPELAPEDEGGRAR